MITSPTRPAATRTPPVSGPSRTPSDPVAAPADPPDPESAETQAALDARIAALVARATTPEDEALERQREEFDFVTRVRAESDREVNVLRDMAMEQMKHDDELLKKWIALI